MAKDRLADWDSTAANNTDVGGINIAEGWPPENVNNAMREKMAQVADFFKDKMGTITSTGSGGTYAITSNDGVAAYAAGQIYAFIANHANTGAATLNVNAIGAKNLVKQHDVALENGDIEANQVVIVAYEATDDTFQMLSQIAQVLVTLDGSKVDIDGTTAETDIDRAADTVLLYDDSATANRKAIVDNFVGPVRAAVQSTASGTSKTFSSIPSWVTKITVMFDEVSTDSAGDVRVQLGDSGGTETTGYVSDSGQFSGSAQGATTRTDSFHNYLGAANRATTGNMVITNITGNVWIASSSGRQNAAGTANVMVGGGSKTLSGTLTDIVVSVSAGNFNGGQVGLMYE